MRTLICGKGEVGTSLYEVLKDSHETYIRDVEPGMHDPVMVDVLNICFPYKIAYKPTSLWQTFIEFLKKIFGKSNHLTFEGVVRSYQARYKPLVTIIHSTVPVGTSRKLGAVHSPIHGRHPNLKGGILTFCKYVGGADKGQVALADEFLRRAGILTQIVDNPETSEHSKLACTRSLGLSAIEMHEIKAECDKFGSNFDQVYGWRKHYNTGYQIMGFSQFTRPELTYTPGPIGGHCVINNCKLNPEGNLEKFILERNSHY